MTLKARTLYSGILSALLVLLGFSGCSTPLAEYGSPSADYKVRGKIVSSKSPGIGIEGIEVSIIPKYRYDPEYGYPEEHILKSNSGSNGDFLIYEQRRGFPSKYTVTIKDIDGEANGLFEDQTIEIEFKKEEYKGASGRWYEGLAEKDLGKIELTPQEIE